MARERMPPGARQTSDNSSGVCGASLGKTPNARAKLPAPSAQTCRFAVQSASSSDSYGHAPCTTTGVVSLYAQSAALQTPSQGGEMHRLHTTELSRDVVWHGHARDLARLVESADANCTCGRGVGPDGLSRPCSTHQILADQHTLDHLAFAQSVLNRLVEEEWRLPATTESRSEKAEWTSFLHVCSTLKEQAPIRTSARERPPRAAFGPWVISLVALIVMLGVGSPGLVTLAPGPQIASWQTR